MTTTTTIACSIRHERAVPGGRKVALDFTVGDETVPGALLVPSARSQGNGAGAGVSTATRVPAVLLLHGYTSRKERMVETAGHALLRRGVASLAIDLPLHGERHVPVTSHALDRSLDLIRRWQAALEECAFALRYLTSRPEVNPSALGVVGYSMGAYVGLIVAAREPAVRAVVLAAGGDLPTGSTGMRVIRAVVDPVAAVQKLAGRPLLMVHGRQDRTVRPDQAERLFEAAAEPKELRWYDSGHYLPNTAIEDAALWLAEKLNG
ncbi:MAG TPA: alpha/beta hydrolase [Gemmatimonadaceae bacterium]|nr:alpha/beta hydrolase [Gemmatimonadaceae bacterium]